MSAADFDDSSLGLDEYIHLNYNLKVRWDPLKSDLLRRTRGLSFEEALKCRFIASHENPTRQNQYCLYAERNGYIWVIPCVNDGNVLFLKTLFPSRKHTKKWLRGEFQ